jgi:hypothetical protein
MRSGDSVPSRSKEGRIVGNHGALERRHHAAHRTVPLQDKVTVIK